jgi:hypothetical protein
VGTWQKKRFGQVDSFIVGTLPAGPLAELSKKWSLTGGLASYRLQRFYKGTELILFLDSFSDQIVRKLRLLRDTNGPITLLRGFGTVTYWRELKGITVAHPGLIYSELMRSSDPRAHDAATELKSEFLKTWSRVRRFVAAA